MHEKYVLSRYRADFRAQKRVKKMGYPNEIFHAEFMRYISDAEQTLTPGDIKNHDWRRVPDPAGNQREGAVPSGKKRTGGKLRVLHSLPGIPGGWEICEIPFTRLLLEMPHNGAGGLHEGRCRQMCRSSGRRIPQHYQYHQLIFFFLLVPNRRFTVQQCHDRIHIHMPFKKVRESIIRICCTCRDGGKRQTFFSVQV